MGEPGRVMLTAAAADVGDELISAASAPYDCNTGRRRSRPAHGRSRPPLPMSRRDFSSCREQPSQESRSVTGQAKALAGAADVDLDDYLADAGPHLNRDGVRLRPARNRCGIAWKR